MKSITSHKTTKLHIKKGDQVMVISGANKGATGEVQQVFPKKYRAIVEGVNVAKKHVIDPSSGKATRIGRKKDGDVTVRFSKRSGEIIK